MNIGVLASHEGTTLQSLIDACATGRVPGPDVVVVGDDSVIPPTSRVHSLAPSTTQAPSRSEAPVRSEARSDPESGSLIPRHQLSAPETMPGRSRRRCSGVP